MNWGLFWLCVLPVIGALLFFRWEIKMAHRSGYTRRKR